MYTFCFTGKTRYFDNREEVEYFIRSRGGQFRSSISPKVDYLVTNNPNSGSSKNKKAQQLGIPVISEEYLISMLGGLG